MESLKQNARRYRADAVIGFSVNIDELSGKGTQMFMITAIGTPVLLNEIKHIQAEAVGGDIDGSVINSILTIENFNDKLQYIIGECKLLLNTLSHRLGNNVFTEISDVVYMVKTYLLE